MCTVQPITGLMSCSLANHTTREKHLALLPNQLAQDLNIFYSGIEYAEKDWVQLKVQHYPLQALL